MMSGQARHLYYLIPLCTIPVRFARSASEPRSLNPPTLSFTCGAGGTKDNPAARGRGRRMAQGPAWLQQRRQMKEVLLVLHKNKQNKQASKKLKAYLLPTPQISQVLQGYNASRHPVKAFGDDREKARSRMTSGIHPFFFKKIKFEYPVIHHAMDGLSVPTCLLDDAMPCVTFVEVCVLLFFFFFLLWFLFLFCLLAV